MRFDWRKRRRWVLWLPVLGLGLAWSFTWVFDAPLRPVLAARDQIREAAVHVSGVACGQFSEGDGFLIEPGLVVTNAHVVAGVEEITVVAPNRQSTTGVLVGFDPGRDIAAISVPELGMPPVMLAPIAGGAGDEGDVAKVDPDHGVEFTPFKVNRRIWATGGDIYGEEADRRQVLEIRSFLAFGDSGAALVNVDGDVLGMVFAVARGEIDRGYALDILEIFDFLVEIERTPLPTPPCRTR